MFFRIIWSSDGNNSYSHILTPMIQNTFYFSESITLMHDDWTLGSKFKHNLTLKTNIPLEQWIGKGGNKTQYAKFQPTDFTGCTWEVVLMDSAVQSLIYINHHDYMIVLNKQQWLTWEQTNRMLKQIISNHLLIAASVIYNHWHCRQHS